VSIDEYKGDNLKAPENPKNDMTGIKIRGNLTPWNFFILEFKED